MSAPVIITFICIVIGVLFQVIKLDIILEKHHEKKYALLGCLCGFVSATFAIFNETCRMEYPQAVIVYLGIHFVGIFMDHINDMWMAYHCNILVSILYLLIHINHWSNPICIISYSFAIISLGFLVTHVVINIVKMINI